MTHMNNASGSIIISPNAEFTNGIYTSNIGSSIVTAMQIYAAFPEEANALNGLLSDVRSRQNAAVQNANEISAQLLA